MATTNTSSLRSSIPKRVAGTQEYYDIEYNMDEDVPE